MKIQKEKLIRFAAYTLFGLLTFIFFLFLTFPFNPLEKQLLRTVEKESGCLIAIKQSEFKLPAKVSWRGITATCPKQMFGQGGTGQIEINLASLNLDLSPVPLILQQKGEIDFRIGSGSGTIPGHLSIATEEKRFSFALQTKKAKINIAEDDLSGLLSIEGESRWFDQDLLKGTGKIAFTLDESVFKSFGGRPLPIGEVRFSKIEGRLSWKEGRVMLEQFTAVGASADLKSESGRLLLRTPLENSLITLSLRATPKGALVEMAKLFMQGFNGRDPLKIRVTGPLRAPQLAVNGKAMRLGF